MTRAWGIEHRGGARANSGGKRAGAGRPSLGTTRTWVRLPADVIKAATQRALELSADLCRPVSRQEVYRRILAGEEQPLAAAGAGRPRKEPLDLEPAQTERLASATVAHDTSKQAAAGFLLWCEDL